MEKSFGYERSESTELYDERRRAHDGIGDARRMRIVKFKEGGAK